MDLHGDGNNPRLDDDFDDDKPWWNDAEKVAGMVATMLMLTAAGVLCIFALGWALHAAF